MGHYGSIRYTVLDMVVIRHACFGTRSWYAWLYDFKVFQDALLNFLARVGRFRRQHNVSSHYG